MMGLLSLLTVHFVTLIGADMLFRALELYVTGALPGFFVNLMLTFSLAGESVFIILTYFATK